MSEQLFPEEVRSQLRLGTSSEWAADLTRVDLPALIWMIGEFGRRADHVLAALDEQWSASPPQDQVATARAKLALEGLFRFFNGDRPSTDEYIARWSALSERTWAMALGRPPESPPEEMGDHWPIVWEKQTVGSLKDPRHSRFGCIGLWVPSPCSEKFLAALDGLP